MGGDCNLELGFGIEVVVKRIDLAGWMVIEGTDVCKEFEVIHTWV